jgi:hypothetical protein
MPFGVGGSAPVEFTMEPFCSQMISFGTVF